jgi:ribosomal protein S18 acetylase RimI-like enzyme
MPEYTIRPMTRPELDWAVDRAADEGWNPGLHDADVFYAQDPGGFLIGELDSKPVGCISAVSYQNARGEGIFGFIGFYIIAPEFRGQGYGIQLWRAAMDKLKGQVLGLDGVFVQQDNYRKSGFEFMYRNIRFEYVNAANQTDQSGTSAAQPQPLNTLPFEQVAAYDQRMFGYPRPAFLSSWLNMPDAVKLGTIREDQLTGFGVIRRCRSGYKIGPLFADDADTAEQIFLDLCAQAKPGEKIYLDVPECNEAGMALAKRYGMGEVFGTARMYAGGKPNLPTDKIFGVTTFELG